MKKKSKVILVCVLALAVLYSLVWLINVKYVYSPWTRVVPKHESGLYVLYDEKTNFIYNVKPPTFPSFTGNLGVSDNEGSGLIIWPGFFGKNYEYGVMIQEEGTTYEIHLDDQMKILDEDEALQKVYRKNQTLIREMWESAEKMWDLDF